MPEYRAVRERYSFLELCKDSDAAAEVTTTAVEVLGVDAAILFADILLILEPLGVGLEFAKGDGPVIHRPVRTPAAVASLPEPPPQETVGYVFDAVRKARAALPAHIPLIGFSGAPFTVASYLVESRGSRNYVHAKKLMYGEPDAWHRLLALLSRTIVAYLNAQIEAGADAVQLFDSWIGCLSPDDYREYVLPHTRAVIQGIRPGVPVIHFGTGTSTLLEAMRDAGGDVLGVDWRDDIGNAWKRIGYDRAIQGNLDPVVLFGPRREIRRRVEHILDSIGDRPGHIFNLGHGILPETPVDSVRYLIDLVHEISAR